MTLSSLFHPAVAAWFDQRFPAPTPVQAEAWQAIKAGRHTLVAAPTGSGKTLAAFLAAIDNLVREGLEGGLADATQVVYVSPLKALSNDVHRNLEAPLGELAARAAGEGTKFPEIRVATRTGDSKWITGEAARADGHRWRRLFPAIAVGAGTIRADNPRLTARLNGTEWCPWRFVFDGLLRSVTDKAMPNVYTDEFRERTIVVTTSHGGMGYVRKLNSMGVKTWLFPSASPKVSFHEFRARCAAEGIPAVFFEGGAQLLSEALQARELDYLFTYHAPVLFADDKGKSILRGLRTESLENAIRLTRVRHEAHGDDTLMRGFVKYPEKMFIDEALFSRKLYGE